MDASFDSELEATAAAAGVGTEVPAVIVMDEAAAGTTEGDEVADSAVLTGVTTAIAEDADPTVPLTGASIIIEERVTWNRLVMAGISSFTQGS